MAKEEPDSFDELSTNIKRVGAHRGPVRRGRGLIQLGAMVAAFAVLFFAGQFAVQQWGASILPVVNDTQLQYPEVAKPSYEVPVVDVVKDSEMAVTVLNGTARSGFASQVGDYLDRQTYHVIARANASSLVDETVIYYNHLGVEGQARSVAETLGVERVELATAFQGSPITVVLGEDYTLPSG